MQKNNKSKIALVKIALITLILILLSGAGVTAVTQKLNVVQIELADGYEMTALTTKTNVKEILEANGVVIDETKKVTPGLEEDITETKKIKVSNKDEQEIEISKASESGLETTLDMILETYENKEAGEEIVLEKIPFKTITKDVSEGASSTKNKVIQEGEEGIKKVTYRVKIQGESVEKTLKSEEIIKEPVDKIIQISSNVVSTRSEISRVKATGTVGEYQEYARERCLDYGWGEDDFSCLVSLWYKESNWNPSCYNKSSGAYGIPQSLPASKMASAGADYLTNYKTQINWGLSYIKSRYGSPSAAWSHFKRVNWY